MSKPGYYKTNYRALRLREMVRWYGWYRGLRTWLKNRFKPPSEAGIWMPGLWAENECKPDDLSPDFWQATKPHRADFEKLGFVQCRLSKVTKIQNLNPRFRDSGSIFYLDPTRCYFGQLIYSRHYFPAKKGEANNIIIAFTAVFERGAFACTNHRLAFDSPRTGRVIRMDSYDVPAIYQRFQEELQRRSDSPRPFSNIESLREWFDARQIEDFEDRVRRRLFVPMSEPEIKAAWNIQQHGGQQPPPLRRRGFRLEYWPAIIFFFLFILIIRYRTHVQGNTIEPGSSSVSGNLIEYQGQQFKMSRPYDSYEDYKDDPNNLDTNELGRIEQTIESVKIPASFKNRDDLIHFAIFDFEFPGYGLGLLGSNATTDDGSTIEVVSVEIPQRDKERIIVVRSDSSEELKPVDDFIFQNGGTNDIRRVLLKHRQLQYFDDQGRLLPRETALK